MNKKEIFLTQWENREIEKFTLLNSIWELDKVITICLNECNFDKVINAYRILEAQKC